MFGRLWLGIENRLWAGPSCFRSYASYWLYFEPARYLYRKWLAAVFCWDLRFLASGGLLPGLEGIFFVNVSSRSSLPAWWSIVYMFCSSERSAGLAFGTKSISLASWFCALEFCKGASTLVWVAGWVLPSPSSWLSSYASLSDLLLELFSWCSSFCAARTSSSFTPDASALLDFAFATD